ncbi:MAG: hypothetical protein ABI977_16410 [Acidobacteriota bacterium]
MNNSNRKLSVAGGREPFGRVTSLEQIPGVLFEILCLAREVKDPKAKTIASLTDDLITVALNDPDTWVKIENMAANGYRIAFSRQNSENP